MSTYRKIHGRSIQAVTTDPTGDITEGQIWYNTVSDTFKTVLASEAWVSGGALITKQQGINSFGTQTAAVGAGGYTNPPAGRPAIHKNIMVQDFRLEEICQLENQMEEDLVF